MVALYVFLPVNIVHAEFAVYPAFVAAELSVPAVSKTLIPP